MAKLSEANIEQIKNMRADKRSYRDIREFFWDTYKIKIYDSEIAKLMREGKKSKRKISKKDSKKILQPQLKTEGEFGQLIHAAYNIHKKDFLKRVEDTIAVM